MSNNETLNTSSQKVGAVAVIGAGIAGMQASLDLADSGFKVYLIERSPTIGGNMAKLDKTFPTGDCAMCTISPRMVGVVRHPNIKLLVNSEAVSLSGEEGNFMLAVRKKARYVDEEACTGCGACAEVCPAYLPSEFNSSIASRKAIYIPFPQAAPLIYTIDKEHCINCNLCELACEPNAIKKDDKDREMVLNVGAVVASAGFEQFNAGEIPEYGFGVYKNVVTNLQFERMLSSSGPTAGKIIKPSDGKEAKKIAFIQCVGSRDVRRYAYCSRICCMASTKEALVAREHDSEIKPTIFYIDMRAFGKGYQEYVDRASKEIRYIRGRVSKIWENKENGNLTLNFENTELGKKESEEFELVVLAGALKPSEGMKELARLLGAELSEYGFFKTGHSATSPFETTRKGVFVAGGATSPMDIPDAISQAGAAASNVISLLSSARGTLTEIPAPAEEKEVSKEEPRVGVFICHCGRNIASVVDVKNVAEASKGLKNVAFSKDVMYACSSMNIKELKQAIKEHNLNRVVVASCSPRMHEATFRSACAEAGLNPYLFEMANIREHCSWVHANDKKAATEKAKDLVTMAVSKSRLLTPEHKGKVKTQGKVLVIGGGASGMASAIACAEQGFSVVIVEKENMLGGWLNKAFSIEAKGKNSQFETVSPGFLLGMSKKIEGNPSISLKLNSAVTNLSGFAGNFTAKVKALDNNKEEEIEAGAIIVATGSEEKKPNISYGKNKRIITLNELESMLKEGKKRLGTVAFIQCAGARDKSYTSCSRTCCIDAIKNARILRKLAGENRALILYRDLMTFGMFEESYLESQKEGVRYIRYAQDKLPKTEEKGESIGIKVYDTLLGAEMEMLADYLVLSTPQVPGMGYEELQKVLRVSANPLGFFMEAHMKLKPVEFISNGIFLAGNCHSPKELSLALAQACAAASKASALLSKGEIETEAITSIVNKELCIGCGRCYAICPFSAITLAQNEKGETKSEINQALCKGCGLCSSVCPNAAITLRGFTREQIIAQIEAALAGAIGEMA